MFLVNSAQYINTELFKPIQREEEEHIEILEPVYPSPRIYSSELTIIEDVSHVDICFWI